MKKYTKDELLNISTDLEELKSEIRNSWGNIFLDFEENNILPEKSLLIEIGDSVVFPFLFKHYFVESDELKTIKDLINRNNNSNSLVSGTKEEKPLFIAEEKIELIKDFLDKGADDFSDYDVIVDSIANKRAIEFLPATHNLALLERLNRDNVGIIFDSYEIEDSNNLDWLLNVITKITPDEFDKVSPDLSNKLAFFMLEYLADNNNAKKLLSLPSFLNNFHKSYEFVNLSDFYDFGIAGVDSEVVYESFKRAWAREGLDKNADGVANINNKLLKFITENLDVVRVKEITGNSIAKLWDKADLNDVNVRASLLKKELPFRGGVLSSNDSYDVNKDLYSVITREDVIAFFNRVAATADTDNYNYNYIYNGNLNNLKEVDFSSEKLDLVAMLVSKIYNNPEGLNPFFNVHKMGSAIFDVMETDNWSDNLVENGGIVSLFRNMLQSEDFSQFENLRSVFKNLKNDVLFERKFKKEINDFLSTNINFDKALIIGMFYSNDLELLEKVDLSLNPVDLDLLKEMGMNFSNLRGNHNVPLSQKENNALLRLFDVDDPDTDLFVRAFSSKVYKKRLARVLSITNKEKLSNTINLLSSLDDREQEFLISIIKREITDNPHVVDDLDKVLKKRISHYKSLRDLLPTSKTLSYKMFLSSMGALNEIKGAYPENDYPPEIKEKISYLNDELNNIPQDIVFEYIKKFIDSDDWKSYKLNSRFDWHLNKILMETRKKLDFNDIETIRYWGKKENSTFNFVNDSTSLTPTGAKLLASIIENNLMSNNYSLYISSIEHLLDDKASRKRFFEAIREKPLLALNNNIFKFSFNLSDDEKKTLLLDGLSELSGYSKEKQAALTKTIMKSQNNDKLKLKPHPLSVEFVNDLKNSVSSVHNKFLLSATTEGIVPNYMDIKSFLNILVGADKFSPKIEILFKEFQLNKEDLKRYKTADEKFRDLFELPYGCLFPELINHKFVKENSVEFAEFVVNHDFNIKYNYISDFYVRGNFIHITEGLEEILKDNVIKFKVKSADFFTGISFFMDSKLPIEQISNFVTLNDDNFDLFMQSVSLGDRFKKKNEEYDPNFLERKFQTLVEMVSKAFLSDELSDENKVFLLNAVELSTISNTILDNSCLGDFGKTVLTEKNVLQNAIIFKNKKHISNVFTNFNSDCIIDDNDNDNEFKI